MTVVSERSGGASDQTRRAPWRRIVAATALFGLVLTLAACGGDDDDDTAANSATSQSGPPPTASAEFCADREKVKDSVDELKDVNIIEDGTSGLKSAVTDVKSDLKSARESASDDLKPQFDAFDDDLTSLEDALKDIDSGGVASAVSALRAAVSSGKTLVESVEALDCSNSS